MKILSTISLIIYINKGVILEYNETWEKLMQVKNIGGAVFWVKQWIIY